jgi:hypothetical protein
MGDLGLKKQSMVINANHSLANKALNSTADDQKQLIQYYMDLALLQRGQLQGEALERFVEKAKSFMA